MIKKIIDNPVVSNIIFYPQKIPIPSNLNSSIKVLKFQLSKNIIIGGFLYLNDPNLPTILLFHGNGEVALGYHDISTSFFECGVNLAVIDYRGYGFSSGKPFYTSLITDALPIYNEFIKWIKEENYNDSIFILGRSLGSVCASEIGAHDPEHLQGIIFSSGFASAYNMMTRLFRLDSPHITPESLIDYSNDTRIKKIKKPVLIIHGTNDYVIPVEESKLIYDNLPEGIEKRLVLIEGADHNNIFLFYRNEYFAPLKEFIHELR